VNGDDIVQRFLKRQHQGTLGLLPFTRHRHPRSPGRTET
jgi:hypothetical protein